MNLDYKKDAASLAPTDWDVFRLGDLVDYIKGFPFKSSEYQSSGIRIVRVSDTTYDSIKDSTPVFVSETKGSHYSHWKLKEQDLVISTVGSKPPMYDSMVGKVILISKLHENSLLNQNAVLVRDKKRRAHLQRLLLDHLRSKRYLAHIEAIFRGNANQASITLRELFQFEIPIPSDEREQHAISSALGDVDALQAGLERLIAKKRDLKQATMQQLLTGQTRLPGFDGAWVDTKLGDVLDTDPENLPANTPPDFSFNYIALEDVDRGYLRGSSEQVLATAPSRARRKIRANDVLVSTVRPNLQSHLVFKERVGNWVCSTGFCVLRCRTGVTNPDYVFAHLFTSSVSHQIDALLTGSNYPAINGTDVQNLQIPLPSYEEQAAIATVLKDMGLELAALEQRLAKTRDLKQGMMQELLTGKTRLITPEAHDARTTSL